ncbi:MAG TPA: MazG nucleotide pyrophosphohydrolase domain-containing protein [Dehalococcoidia bacterium]|nr:MazG nucleotide pyrophosphohydrolase domain-containing protein [Dehalococcoidia bacterium]
MVREFHEVFGVAVADRPLQPAPETVALRRSLIEEEKRELFEAMEGDDLAQVAKELADLLYVVYGTAVSYGIETLPVFAEVHRSNMEKAPGGVVKRRPDGKVLKPEGWQPPDIAAVLHKQLR